MRWTPHPLSVRMYVSRYPTLRTVRINGDGSVWVDGVRRRVRYDAGRGRILYPSLMPASLFGWPMVSFVVLADAMEPAR